MSKHRAVRPTSVLQDVARWLLAAGLAVAGVGHFLSADAFAAQVPPWVPYPDAVVYGSGLVEVVLAIALLRAKRRRALVGWIVAAFFVVVFPGNISQFVTQTDAFGLDTDLARGVRLLFQPLLVVWAVWCTGAWRAARTWLASRRATGSGAKHPGEETGPPPSDAPKVSPPT